MCECVLRNAHICYARHTLACIKLGATSIALTAHNSCPVFCTQTRHRIMCALQHPLDMCVSVPRTECPCHMYVRGPLTRASVSCGSSSVSLLRFRLFTCSSTRLKCSSALRHSLSRNDVTTSCSDVQRSDIYVCLREGDREREGVSLVFSKFINIMCRVVRLAVCATICSVPHLHNCCMSPRWPPVAQSNWRPGESVNIPAPWSCCRT